MCRVKWLLAGSLALLALLLGVLVPGGGAAATASARPRFGAPRRIFTGLYQAWAAATGGTLWLADEPPTGPTVLVRLDARTGAVQARLTLGDVNVSAILYAEGWLWLTTDSDRRGPVTPRLWRLAADSLTVMSTTPLRSRLGFASLASAGASLWVGDGGELDQVATIGGSIIRRVRLPGASLSIVGTGPGGQSLLVSEGNEAGVARVERRDAVTGALLARSARFLGVTAPWLGGTAGPRLWLSEATGMAGYIEQLWVRSLRPTHARTPSTLASNGVRARVIDGILWVTDPGGGAQLNYCADPITGRPRLALPRAVRRGFVLTADAARLYYQTSLVAGSLASLAIPAGCR